MTVRTRLGATFAALAGLAGCGGDGEPATPTDSDTAEPAEITVISDYKLILTPATLDGQLPFSGSPEITLLVRSPDDTVTFIDAGSDGVATGLPPLEQGTEVGILVEDGGTPEAWEPERTVAYGQVTLPERLELGEQEVRLDVLVPAFADLGLITSPAPSDQRVYGAMAMVPDGRTYLFGGTPVARINGGFQVAAMQSVFRLDPTTPDGLDFVQLDAVLPTATFTNDVEDRKRAAATATTYTVDGETRILVAGGRVDFLRLGDNTDAVHIFDPATETFVADLQMPRPRSEHTALLLDNGDILLDGGLIDEGRFGSTSAIFHPDDNSFTEVELGTDVGSWRRGVASLGSEGALICGGARATILFNDDWEATTGCVRLSLDGRVLEAAPLPEPLAGHVLTPLGDGKVLCTGGNDLLVYNSAVPDAVARTYIYDVNTDSWANGGQMISPRVGHRAVALPSGDVLLVGGVQGLGNLFGLKMNEPVDCGERYDAGNDRFTILTSCVQAGIGIDPQVTAWPVHGAVVVSGLYAGPDEASSPEAVGLIGFGPSLP